MIYPKRNKPVFWFFHYYLLWLIQRNFQAINFNTVEIEKEKSVLLLANHFSWWDAFLVYYVNTKLFKKKMYVMVLEETMRKEWIMARIGAFSIDKNSREVINSLKYAAELLNDPRNLVLIFPQGKLYSNFINEIHFEAGTVKTAQIAAGKFQTVLAAMFIENFQFKKPSVNCYLAINTNCKFENIEALTRTYQQHYSASMMKQTQIVV